MQIREEDWRKIILILELPVSEQKHTLGQFVHC